MLSGLVGDSEVFRRRQGYPDSVLFTLLPTFDGLLPVRCVVYCLKCCFDKLYVGGIAPVLTSMKEFDFLTSFFFFFSH